MRKSGEKSDAKMHMHILRPCLLTGAITNAAIDDVKLRQCTIPTKWRRQLFADRITLLSPRGNEFTL